MPESKLDLVVAGTARCRADGRIGSQGAVRGHHARRRHVRPQRLPAGDRRDHQAGREGRQGAARLRRRRTTRRSKTGDARRSSRPTCAPPTRSPARQSATPPSPRPRRRSWRHCCPDGDDDARAPSSWSAACSRSSRGKIVRCDILETGKRIDGRDLTTVRPIVARGRRPAAHPRLGAVHPRRDAGARRRHARHRRGRAV